MHFEFINDADTGAIDSLSAVDAPALATELADARVLRMKFLPPTWPEPYLNAVVRAFRLARGATSYLEISTRDKGHIAWVSTLLAPDATIADIDKLHFPDNERLISQHIKSPQKFIRVVTDPNDAASLSRLRTMTKGLLFDVVFANGEPFYKDCIRDFNLYFQFVKPGGVFITTDAYWEGNESRKGKAQALALIDRAHPTYCVHMDLPIHRFTPLERAGGDWGTLAIIPRQGTAHTMSSSESAYNQEMTTQEQGPANVDIQVD